MKRAALLLSMAVVWLCLASCMTKSVTQNVYISNSHNVTVSTEDSQAKPVDVSAEVPISGL